MTLVVKTTTIDEVSDFFLKDDKLSYIGLPDNDLVSLINTGKYVPNPISFYQGIYESDELITFVKIEYYTEVAANVHMYISSKLHGTGRSKEIGNFLIDWFTHHTDFHKLIVMAPDCCIPVHKTALKLGFKKEGHITKALRWRDKLVDILVFGLELDKRGI